jgi:hypothetical protein
VESVFQQVRQRVDLRLFYPFTDEAREFEGGYFRDLCIAPDHTDTAPSLLIYPDGVYCTACGFRADAVEVYCLYNEGLRPYQAALELLAGEYKLDPNTVIKLERRLLSRDLATRAHLRLAQEPAYIARLQAMGFTKRTIRRAQLGLAEVGVLIGGTQKDPIYENQLRFAVPVWAGDGGLLQVIYRRIDDLYDGRGPKTQVEAKAGSHLMGLHELDGADMVLICEGWGDKLIFDQLLPALRQFYQNPVCVTSTNGAGHWNDTWAEHLMAVRHGFVLGDADMAGQKLVDRVRRRLPWFRPLPPLGPLGTKYDLRDWYLAGGRDLYPLLRRARFEAAKRRLEAEYGANGATEELSHHTERLPERDQPVRSRPRLS